MPDSTHEADFMDGVRRSLRPVLVAGFWFAGIHLLFIAMVLLFTDALTHSEDQKWMALGLLIVLIDFPAAMLANVAALHSYAAEIVVFVLSAVLQWFFVGCISCLAWRKIRSIANRQ
ncbi:hypothetical protein [Mariniblastus fucicola]|nr:hypothetical protein [Mariniblastus fucicola]